MIKVRIFGGLGNQMFQYAAGKVLSLKHGVPLIFDISFFKSNYDRKFMLSLFNISKDTIILEDKKFAESAIARKVMGILKLPRWYFRNYGLVYDDKFQELEDNTYLDGYFQSEKYFKDIEDIIRKEFVPSFKLSRSFNKWKQIIGECNSVSLHVRRGDYLNKKNVKIHGVLRSEYYEKAISIFRNRTENPFFFIFSDDEVWCKKMILPIVGKGRIVKINSVTRDVEELFLMGECKHNIIANSSFSWWGAWLNNKKDKIILYPKEWSLVNKNVSSLFPDNWNAVI